MDAAVVAKCKSASEMARTNSGAQDGQLDTAASRKNYLAKVLRVETLVQC